VKLCRFGRSGFDVGKERLVATSTKGACACEGDRLGELDVVSDGEVVFGDVVVVEEDEDEVFSLTIFVLSDTCFIPSIILFFVFVN